MKKDIYAHSTVQQIVDPVVVAATTASAAVDLKSHEGCLLIVNVGENGQALDGTDYFTFTVTESDDDNTYTAVSAGDLVGETTGNTFGVDDGAADDDTVYSVGYAGTKRYVKVNITESGTISTGTPMSVTAIKYGKKYV